MRWGTILRRHSLARVSSVVPDNQNEREPETNCGIDAHHPYTAENSYAHIDSRTTFLEASLFYRFYIQARPNVVLDALPVLHSAWKIPETISEITIKASS